MASAIRVTVQPNTFQVRPDWAPLRVPVQVENAGTTVDQFKIQVDGLHPDWYTLPNNSVALFPTDRAMMELQLHPLKEEARSGAYPFTITVASSVDPTLSTQVQATLTVPKVVAFDLDMSPTKVVGRRARYHVEVLNTGNTSLSLAFDARDAENQCFYSFRPEDAELEPGRRIAVQLLVTSPRSALHGEPKFYDVEVKVKPAGEQAKMLHGQFFHTPLLRTWRPIRRLIILAVLIAAGISVYPTVQPIVAHKVFSAYCEAVCTATPSPTRTGTPTATASSTPSSTPTATVTSTPTGTATVTPLPTATARPATPQRIIVVIPPPPAAHSTPTPPPPTATVPQSATAQPTATQAPTVAPMPPTAPPRPRPAAPPTSTPRPPDTPTPRPLATHAPRPSATRIARPLVPPSSTPRATNTPTSRPLATHVPRPSATAPPRPTATRTPKPTATQPPTHTPRPTATRTPKPTTTPPPTHTPRPTATYTPRPTATHTPRPTATRTPLPTRTPTPMPVSAFNPGPYHAVVQTVFANGAGNAWPVGQGTNGSTQLSNGRYALTSSGGRTFVRNPEEFQHQAAGEVQATLSLAGTGRAGVMGRWSQTPDGQQSMYAFWIADNGTFGLTRWQQGSASELATPQASPFIHRGGDNELVLRAQGDELTCWINGGQVFSHSDSSPLAAGDWGLYVASQLGGATVTGSYTQVTIYSKNL